MAETLTGRTLGTYQIEDPIGASRWGGVYRASQRSMSRTVALKTVSPEMAGQAAHFLQEMQAAAQISHSNIATIYEAGCIDGITFCAMEYIHGPALPDFLRKGNLVDEQHLLQAITAVARALDFLWQKKIAHQPLEAKNILVDANHTIKLINVLPLDHPPVAAMKDDMLAVGLVLAHLANEISPVTKRVGELVERMVAAAGRKPFTSLTDLAQTAADLEHQLYPPTVNRAPAPAPKKMSKLGLALATGIGVLSAAGIFWVWQKINHNIAPSTVTRPADFGTMVKVTGGAVGKKTVKDFYLDRYAVTLGEYKQFLDAIQAGVKVKEDIFVPSHKSHTPDNWNAMLTAIQQRRPLQIGDQQLWLTWDSPVIGVDWYDAFAYANWRGKRLPTDEEMDCATRTPPKPASPPPPASDNTEVYTPTELRTPNGIAGLFGKMRTWTYTSPTRSTSVVRGGNTRRAELPRETRSDTVTLRCAADKEVK